MFSAADEEQWKLIARQIDQSDYYVVIVAHRYGSIVGKKSYTEKEYDYAIQKGVPVIGFIIDDSAPWPKDKMESDSNKAEALNRFKQKVKRKPIGFWSVKDELCGKVITSLVKLIATNPRPGWIRTSETVGPEVVSEMSRLSSENARLSSENAQLKQQLEESLKIDNSHFSQGEDQIDIAFYFYIDQLKNEDIFRISWDNLFLNIGKIILEKTAESSVMGRIENMIYMSKKDSFSWLGKATSISIQEGELLKIKTQFIALGYIDIQIITSQPNTNGQFRSLDVDRPHWILTSSGKRKFAELLAIRRSVDWK